MIILPLVLIVAVLVTIKSVYDHTIGKVIHSSALGMTSGDKALKTKID